MAPTSIRSGHDTAQGSAVEILRDGRPRNVNRTDANTPATKVGGPLRPRNGRAHGPATRLLRSRFLVYVARVFVPAFFSGLPSSG
jgi:hypothetical protein